MISENVPPRQIPAALSETHGTEGSYLDWAAILAGGIFALAISFLLFSFGASLGLSLTSPYRGEGVSAAWLAIATGIWFAWVMVTAFGAGGYFAGRMRRRAGDATEDEVEVRDGAHGLMVWAIGSLVATVLTASGAGSLLSSGASALGSTASSVTDVAVSSDYFANLMLRGNIEEPNTGTDAADATTPANESESNAETGAPADGSATVAPIAAPDTAGVTSIDSAVRQEIAGIITRSAAEGEIAERDSSYLARLVAANSGLDEEAARARVDQVTTEIDDARTAALEALEKARVAGVVLGFIAAATLLIGGVAAFFASVAGGRHRDEGLGLDVLTTRR